MVVKQLLYLPANNMLLLFNSSLENNVLFGVFRDNSVTLSLSHFWLKLKYLPA